MRANPGIVLDLYGSAYEFNDAAKNQELALARALAVRDYLVETAPRLDQRSLALSP